MWYLCNWNSFKLSINFLHNLSCSGQQRVWGMEESQTCEGLWWSDSGNYLAAKQQTINLFVGPLIKTWGQTSSYITVKKWVSNHTSSVALEMAKLVGRSVNHFGPDWHVLTTVRLTAMTVSTDINCHEMTMNCYDFLEHLTFCYSATSRSKFSLIEIPQHLYMNIHEPQSTWMWFCLNSYWIDCHKIWFKYLCKN